MNKWQQLNSWNITDQDLEKKDYNTKVDNTPKPKILISRDKVKNIDIERGTANTVQDNMLCLKGINYYYNY